ncbi:hypothetical protein GAYE_PCTG69G1471 [Galdieria yellowstonensis]|uniref:FAS1 domain-containing protein n=1 Tax=Galdieria yellowstonensis TaxID=3028027 RepID=A0AAV9I892_9RHOD|nr:hypothetical protein GAYE_PCTG69G1471 [Galdieria yellowstonensis]
MGYKLRYFILFLVVTASSVCAFPPFHASRCAYSNTIAAELEKMKDFTTLLTLAKIANLTSTLENPYLAVTLFAPTNEGIASTLKALNIPESAVVQNSALVKKIIEYHILPEPLVTSEFSDFNTYKTLEGSDVTVTRTSTGIFVNGVEIIKKNIMAGESIIQVIDGLLIPPNVVV